MRTKLFFIGLWSLIYLMPALSMAQTVYVSDASEIPLRRGPSLEHKILKFLNSSHAIQVLEEKGGWSRVKLTGNDKSGLEGWMLTRYLMTRLPWKAQVEKLQTENDSLKNELSRLQKKDQNETTSSVQLEEAYHKNLEELNALKKEYAAFKQASGDFVQLKANYEISKNNEARLALELRELENSKQNKWFALGALVLLFGLIIGLQIGKQGRRGRSALSL